MPKAPIYNGSSNPNAKGGAFGYDGRTGLGIGSLGGDPNSGIGRNWNMGDALSSPKSEYDIDDEDREEEYDELDADIESKAHSSYHRGATDSLAHRGGDISSLGGLGNSMAGVIGLSAGKKLNGDIMSEQSLKQYIKEVILLEKRNGQMSGPIVVRRGGKGSMYKNTMASTNTADASPNRQNGPKKRHGFNSKGYGQGSVTVAIQKADGSDLEIPMTPDTDGVKCMYVSHIRADADTEIEDAFEKGESTASGLTTIMSKEARDQENVDFYSRR